jgi:methyl-accepting chemotaxis protein
MTISQRLTLLLTITICSIALLVAINIYEQREISALTAQSELVKDIELNLLELRRNEKDFRLRLDMKYADKHSTHYQGIIEKVALLQENVVGNTAQLSSLINIYRNSFVDYVSVQKKIGLTPEDGYYGGLRTAIHNLESSLKTVNAKDVQIDMLLCRRHEKDFMLRNDPKYIDATTKQIEVLIKSIKNATLTEADTSRFIGLVEDYRTAFQALAAGQQQLGIKGVKGITDAMSTNAHEAETLLTSFAQSANQVIAQTLQRLTMISTTIIFIVVTFLIAMVFWTRKIILSSLSTMKNNIGAMLNAGKFNTPLVYTDKDEIADVVATINDLLKSLDGAISEANHVVGAIAQADFNQRMKGFYVGDLDLLKQGVNASANSVSFMMDELGNVMQGLDGGHFDVRMDKKVPKAFRDLVEKALLSINRVIVDINTVMTQMSEGDFSARVNADARGDLLAMKTNVNHSMDQIELAMKSISTIVAYQSKGDLTNECTAMLSGQLEQTKQALNSTSRRLKEVVSQAVNISNVVNNAAEQVSQGSSALSSRVQEQAAALEETSATMNEMATAVQANTTNARKVADLTNQVQNQATDGVQVMQQTITAMQSIKESSSKISDIVTIIDSIAFQTNLLALNAAVEAARAGEHGRGFAVVASEVRALAGKSAEAAKDIKTLITDSVTRIENGTHLADKSGEMLNGIAGSIHQVASMIDQIATASNEQSIGINQVHRAIADIDKVTQENAALVEETTAAAESLSTEANNLRNNLSST